MERIKHILRSIFFPPRAVGVCLGVAFLLFVGAVFLFGQANTPIAYVAYALSTYGLYLLIVSLVIPLIRLVKARLQQNEKLAAYFSDPVLRARVKLYRGAVFNIGYAAFKFAMGLYYGSHWFLVIAVYYAALIVMKLGLIGRDARVLHQTRRLAAQSETDDAPLPALDDPLRDWRTYRRAGVSMLVLDATLIGIIYLTVVRGQSYSYPGTMIFAMAAYAFYRITISLIRLFQKETSPIFSAAKAIDLSVAIVAMYALQTAMLSTFGDGDSALSTTFNAVSGLAVWILVLMIAVGMLLLANRSLRQAKTPTA